MKYFLFIFFVLFGLVAANAQFTYFNRLYNNDVWSTALTILEPDTGYMICGVSGEVSNGYIFTRIVLSALDDEGNQLWWKTYGEDFHNYYAGLMRGGIKTSDGGYAISGTVEDEIRAVGLLMKFDRNGDSLWSRIYGDTISPAYFSTSFNLCQQLPDKGYLLVGGVYVSGNDEDVLLIRTDSSGNTLWRKQYGILTWIEQAFSMAQLPDGGFLIGINRQYIVTSNMINDPGLLKVDSLGNMSWMQYYGGIYEDGAPMVCLSTDGNYLVGSVYAMEEQVPDYPEHKIWIFKTDTAGTVLWDRTYSETRFLGWCSTIEELSDGSIIVSGTGYFEDAFGSNAWILKADKGGDSIWMRRYAHFPGHINELWDLITTSDNGIIFTGLSMYDEQSIWVQKLDSIGCDSSGCDTTVWIAERHEGMEAWGHGSMEIWPNPAKDWIHVQTVLRYNELCGNTRLFIFNMFGENVGEMVIPRGNEIISFNISGLPNGIYLAVIRKNERIISSSKFLISH